MAVKWSLEGLPYREIQKVLKVSLGFISKCKNNFIESGIEGIKLSYQGSYGYLSKEEKEEIILWLREKSDCNLEELTIHIEEVYGVIYQSRQSDYLLLKLSKNRS